MFLPGGSVPAVLGLALPGLLGNLAAAPFFLRLVSSTFPRRKPPLQAFFKRPLPSLPPLLPHFSDSLDNSPLLCFILSQSPMPPSERRFQFFPFPH